jgi:hypothetical protein
MELNFNIHRFKVFPHLLCNFNDPKPISVLNFLHLTFQYKAE